MWKATFFVYCLQLFGTWSQKVGASPERSFLVVSPTFPLSNSFQPLSRKWDYAQLLLIDNSYYLESGILFDISLKDRTAMVDLWQVKFIYSEKTTKFCEIFPLLLTVCTVVKSKGKISQNFAAFSALWTLTCSWRFLTSNEFEQLKFKRQKLIGI